MWLDSFRPPRLKPVGEPDEWMLAEMDFGQRICYPHARSLLRWACAWPLDSSQIPSNSSGGRP